MTEAEQVFRYSWLRWAKIITWTQVVVGGFGILLAILGWMFFQFMGDFVDYSLLQNITETTSTTKYNFSTACNVSSTLHALESLVHSVKSEASVYSVLMYVMVTSTVFLLSGLLLRTGVTKGNRDTLKIWMTVAVFVLIVLFICIVRRIVKWDATNLFYTITFHFHVVLLPLWVFFTAVVHLYSLELLPGLGGLAICYRTETLTSQYKVDKVPILTVDCVSRDSQPSTSAHCQQYSESLV